MPSKADHLTKTEGNARFAMSLTLDDQPSIDWALVALFYSAMHHVEAYLATRGEHLRSHRTRDSVVGRDSKLKPIFADYQELKFYGYNARYEMLAFKARDVEIAVGHLEAIRLAILSFL